MAESFITELNGVITGKHHGDIGADLFGTPYYGHNKVPVPFDTEAVMLEPLKFYTQDWKRKPDVQLIKEGLLPMPRGYKWDGEALRTMTAEERIIEGLDEPQPGYKIEDGKLVAMTLREQLEAGKISQDEYTERITAINKTELNRRLATLIDDEESKAQAEIDEEYAAERKAKIIALLAVKKQLGWPFTVEWPE